MLPVGLESIRPQWPEDFQLPPYSPPTLKPTTPTFIAISTTAEYADACGGEAELAKITGSFNAMAVKRAVST